MPAYAALWAFLRAGGFDCPKAGEGVEALSCVPPTSMRAVVRALRDAGKLGQQP